MVCGDETVFRGITGLLLVNVGESATNGLPRFFKSQGTSTTTSHSENVNVSVELMLNVEKFSSRDLNDGVIWTEISQGGDHNDPLVCLLLDEQSISEFRVDTPYFFRLRGVSVPQELYGLVPFRRLL